jgi:hypothetical protein
VWGILPRRLWAGRFITSTNFPESISQRLAEKRAALDEAQKLLPESQRVSLAKQKRAVLAALA